MPVRPAFGPRVDPHRAPSMPPAQTLPQPPSLQTARHQIPVRGSRRLTPEIRSALPVQVRRLPGSTEPVVLALRLPSPRIGARRALARERRADRSNTSRRAPRQLRTSTLSAPGLGGLAVLYLLAR